jgi:hypothetical protein
MPHAKVNGDLTIAIRARTVNDMTMFYTRMMISYDDLGGAKRLSLSSKKRMVTLTGSSIY